MPNIEFKVVFDVKDIVICFMLVCNLFQFVAYVKTKDRLLKYEK